MTDAADGSLSYRPDVDGLRAVAVLAVVAFHAGAPVHGGFVGVDVFFVISGFLITGIILKAKERSQFSLSSFWVRRICRIWPACLATLAVSTLAAIVILLPDALIMFGNDLIACVAMAANVRFWLGTDYFAPAAEMRPLLHMWSLAVEEQFYLLFPLLLGLPLIAERKRLLAAFLMLMIGSLIWSLWLQSRDPRAAFFLLPARASELLVGAALAASPDWLGRFPRAWAPLAGAIGLGAIVCACVMFDSNTRFPGVAVLVPVIGTALVIASGCRAHGPVYWLLSRAPMRFVGLVSFSLYLWHWPVLAYAHYLLGFRLSGPVIGVLLAVIALLALASWRWIEEPLRRPSSVRRRNFVVAGAVLASFALLGVGVALRLGGGWPARFAPQIVSFGNPGVLDTRWSLLGTGDSSRECTIPIGAVRTDGRESDFLLWGDSHAMVIAGTIDQAARKHGFAGRAAIQPGTPPIPSSWQPSTDAAERLDRSDEFSKCVIQSIRSMRPGNVILCARWSLYLGSPRFLLAPLNSDRATPESARVAMADGLAAVASVCREVGSRLWIVLEIPSQNMMPAGRAALANLTCRSVDLLGTPLEEHAAATAEARTVVLASIGDMGSVIDLSESMFGADGRSRVGEGGQSWYFDGDHLSPAGATRIAGPVVEQLFESDAFRRAR